MSDFIPFALPDIGEDEIAAVVGALRSGWLTTGRNASAFEAEFADFIGGGTAIAVNSATAGLHLALEALGVGPGDEVLVPNWTFTATAEVVRYLGADPVLVDVDSRTLNLDLEAAAGKVTAQTKAVVPVHFAGLPMPRSRLASFAAEHRLIVVEDSAHAFPCISEGQPVGAGLSDAVVFSFYATKTMTTGEGGMVVVRNKEVAERIQTMRLHGISRPVFDRYQSTKPAWQYEVVAPGYKYNLTDPAAAMGRVQLGRASQMRRSREAVAERYDQAFRDLPVILPAHAPAGDTHAWHLYVLRLSCDAPVDRDTFIERMSARGVGTSVHFIPLHKQPYWRDRYHLLDSMFPISSAQYERVVSLPIFSSMTSEQVGRVVGAVREVLAR